MRRLRLDLLAYLMEIDLLLSELERLTPLTERLNFHSAGQFVKLARRLNVQHGQNQVVKPVDTHRRLSFCCHR